MLARSPWSAASLRTTSISILLRRRMTTRILTSASPAPPLLCRLRGDAAQTSPLHALPQGCLLQPELPGCGLEDAQGRVWHWFGGGRSGWCQWQQK